LATNWPSHLARAREMRLEAERQLGKMLEPYKAGRPPQKLLQDVTISRPKLPELGIERVQSHRWQLEASVPELALKVEPLIAEKAMKRMIAGVSTDPPQISAEGSKDRETREQVAKLAGVSHDTIAKVKMILEKAAEPVKEELRRGAAQKHLWQHCHKCPGVRL